METGDPSALGEHIRGRKKQDKDELIPVTTPSLSLDPGCARGAPSESHGLTVCAEGDSLRGAGVWALMSALPLAML